MSVVILEMAPFFWEVVRLVQTESAEGHRKRPVMAALCSMT
jgi:hypothetical protein